MENKNSKVLDIISRSFSFIVINYFLISMELSFMTSIMGWIASIVNIWMVMDYYQSIKSHIGRKSVTVLFCVLCYIASTAFAYFVGYVHGTIILF